MAYVRWDPKGDFYIADSFDRAGELNYCATADSIGGTTLTNSAVSDYVACKSDAVTTSFVADVADFRHELDKVIGRVAALECGNVSSCAEKTSRFKAAWRYNRRAYKTLANC